MENDGSMRRATEERGMALRIKHGFILKEIAGEYYAIPVDESYESFGAMIALNETGAFLWQELETECSVSALQEALVKKYGIEDALAGKAVQGFLDSLREKSLLEGEAR
ncbi:PqqD family protein [Oscillospiraceae bacterium DSM 107454]|uniref:PqqD family protein n=2 Tax=Ructibacterium gallinarum TaxID=2779355 RepID=A0A9D5R825_9FIRM|nr:PqqD family protein [Ructibacterium gallinarum]